MSKENETIILFRDKKVRRHFDENKEIWYFSIIDVVEILTESPRLRKYWNALKTKLIEEGSELSQRLGQLKLISSDGKKYLTDVAGTENLLRLIQSIPSLKAELLKRRGKIAKTARDEIEKDIGESVVINKNLKYLQGKE
jgi:hypothetical protein